MAKIRILSTDLIWKFHEELNEFEKYTLHGISIAIVPDGNGAWRALTTHRVQTQRRIWVERIDAIERQLRKRYVLASEWYHVEPNRLVGALKSSSLLP